MSKFAIAKQLSVRYEPQTDEFGEAADPVTTVGLGATCQTQMHKALCATCDGEIGTGQATGMCNSFCGDLLEACKDEFMDLTSLSMKSGESIPFCRAESLMC